MLRWIGQWVVNKEVEELRRLQIAKAMPIVSQILEEWEQVPNDARGALIQIAPALVGSIMGLDSAMEDFK